MKISYLNIAICLFFIIPLSFILSEVEETKIQQSNQGYQIPHGFTEIYNSVSPDEKKIIAILIYYQLKLNEAEMAANQNWQDYNQKLLTAINNEKDPKKQKILRDIQTTGEPSNDEEKVIWDEFDLSKFEDNATLISNHAQCIRILGLIAAINESEKFEASTQLKDIFLNELNKVAEQYKKTDLKTKAEKLKKQHEIIFNFYKYVYQEIKKNKLTFNITIGFDERLPDPNDVLENHLYPGYIPSNCPYLL